MADAFTPRFVDLVRNYSTTAGTGNFVLGPAVTGFTSFATALQPGDRFYYSAIGFDKAGEREIGRGTLNADRTISREPLTGVLTNFSGGTKLVALVTAAEWYQKLEAGGGGGPGSSVRVKTPYDFGAKGADTAALDASFDDSTALQAFFDDAFDPANSATTYDWSGHWAISKPLYFVRPLVNSGELNVEYHARNFVCGTLHVLPVAKQLGGAPMETVLTISGPHSQWGGSLFIHDGGRGTTPYANRRFNVALKLLQCAQGRIDSVTVFGAKRDAVVEDTNYESWTERQGTAFEAGSVSKNSIGLQIGRVFAAGCGSMHAFAGYGHEQLIASYDQGSDPLDNGVFSTTSAGYGNSANQRTEITVASTAEIRAGDFGKVRTEVPGATFTAIAADSATSKLSWTSGDPVAAGLLVGQRFTLQDTGGVGANDGTTFEIVAFGGTSNRDITVRPAPVTEGAKAYSGLQTKWSLHRVCNVPGATKFLVHPWIPDGTNSKWLAIHGFLVNSFGIDSASTFIGYAGASKIGGGIRSAGLYGVRIGELLVDHAEVGLVIGATPISASVGTVVNHRHIEGTIFPLVQVAISAAWYLGEGSGLSSLENCALLGSRATTASATGSSLSPIGGTFIHGGRIHAFAVTSDGATARTAGMGDASAYVRFTGASPITYTIPPSVTVDFPLGTVIEIEQGGMGALSVAGAPGVTVNSRGADLTLAGQYSVAALKKVAADTWTLTGDL